MSGPPGALAATPLQGGVFDPGWVGRNLDRIVDATVEHLVLTGLSVGWGLVLSLGLAVLVLAWRRAYGTVLGVAGILFTIPSLAAFAVLVPRFGFSVTTAVIALTSYTLLILVKNIVDGIDGVPDEVLEAARGMGYRPVRLFWTVQVPLALPVIVAGIRVATVTVIGLVTVTALLGLGGLGSFILAGFRVLPPYPTQIIVGTALSVVLAVVLDLTLLGVERVLTPWTRRRTS